MSLKVPEEVRDKLLDRKEKRCEDFDEDCTSIFLEKGINGCVYCWLYQPEKGYCPYLRGGFTK